MHKTERRKLYIYLNLYIAFSKKLTKIYGGGVKCFYQKIYL